MKYKDNNLLLKRDILHVSLSVERDILRVYPYPERDILHICHWYKGTHTHEV
jgi:hypothetical protein